LIRFIIFRVASENGTVRLSQNVLKKLPPLACVMTKKNIILVYEYVTENFPLTGNTVLITMGFVIVNFQALIVQILFKCDSMFAILALSFNNGDIQLKRY